MANESVDTTDTVEMVRAGYGFAGPVLELGALVVAGAPVIDAQVRIPLAMTNRHGLVAGATGTGKTRTLQVLAEQLSAHGVPVFAADIKGDLSGIAAPGASSDRLSARTASLGQEWTATGFPVEFYALGGLGTGIPLRATMTSFGPTLLSKVLGLTDIQESSLGLVFHYADKAGLPLLDLKDLRALIQYLTSDEGKQELTSLGGLSKQTAGVLLRELISFEDQGADVFFGEPEFDTANLLRAADGAGSSRCSSCRSCRTGRHCSRRSHVVARGSVRGAARGRRHRQAKAGVLLRRGTPALHDASKDFSPLSRKRCDSSGPKASASSS